LHIEAPLNLSLPKLLQKVDTNLLAIEPESEPEREVVQSIEAVRLCAAHAVEGTTPLQAHARTDLIGDAAKPQALPRWWFLNPRRASVALLPGLVWLIAESASCSANGRGPWFNAIRHDPA